MTDPEDKNWKNKAAVAGAAIGSAALAAAVLYMTRKKTAKPAPAPTKDAPETD
ncbi:hypothetical protein OKA06_09570 [Novosphingobium sp. MW5]|nr:hypothetical protein [Novosphingobium sp. MW5]